MLNSHPLSHKSKALNLTLKSIEDIFEAIYNSSTLLLVQLTDQIKILECSRAWQEICTNEDKDIFKNTSGRFSISPYFCFW